MEQSASIQLRAKAEKSADAVTILCLVNVGIEKRRGIKTEDQWDPFKLF